MQFYEGNASFVDLVIGHLEAGLRAGEACVVLATRAHRELIEARLHERRDQRSAAVTALDAEALLAKFMVKGLPNEKRFAATLGAILRRATEGGRRRVTVFGEMVSVLLAQGNVEATLRLEQFWNQLIADQAFSLMCCYPLRALRAEEHHRALRMICAEHSGVRLP